MPIVEHMNESSFNSCNHCGSPCYTLFDQFEDLTWSESDFDCDFDDYSDSDTDEFDDSSLTSSAGDFGDVPFWFYEADEAYIKFVVAEYIKFLDVDIHCGWKRRFIGQIKRVHVDNSGFYTTLDSVYEHCMPHERPVGACIDVCDVYSVLTMWNEDGEPISMIDLSNKPDIYNIWRDKQTHDISYISCLPSMGFMVVLIIEWQSDDMNIVVSRTKKEVSFQHDFFHYTDALAFGTLKSDDITLTEEMGQDLSYFQ